jgi:hypothetical protein
MCATHLGGANFKLKSNSFVFHVTVIAEPSSDILHAQW